MRAAFLIGLVLGIAGVLAAARYAPWVELPRLPSQTSVVTNSGRAEQFVIRLPADRISMHGSAESGLRGQLFPAGAVLPDALLSQPILVEQFKVRDRDDNVIGIAARHWTRSEGDSPTAAWLVVIPSRGGLLMVADGDEPGAVDRAVAAAGFRQGEAWSGEVRIDAIRDSSGRILDGSGEFTGLDGTYTETWTVTGVGADGELKGTIELGTVARARS